MHSIIDLRSDTLTIPTKDMLSSMREGSLGDDGYGEDCSTNSLQTFCADYFCKEAALFMSSGTMSNQVAIRCWTQPGDEIILDNTYHINYFEAGATVDLGKVYLNLCHTKDGIIREHDLLAAIENKHRSSLSSYPTLLCLENTINTLSGKIYPLDDMRNIYACAKENNLNVHLDGARLLNACASLNIHASEYSHYADSLTICFSKGLGAPFGSMLMGTKEFIEKAKKYRKWYGGGLHQSGPMASAALFAMQNNISRLKKDHEKALELARFLQFCPGIKINMQLVETNIVMIDISETKMHSTDFTDALRKETGVILYSWNPHMVRAVTSMNVSHSDVLTAGKQIQKFLYNRFRQFSKRCLHG